MTMTTESKSTTDFQQTWNHVFYS